MTTTFHNDPIDHAKPLSGNDRWAHINSAPPEAQEKVIQIILEECRAANLSIRDTAYYLAIAKRESGFNPDAANPGSTASGIAQVIEKTGNALGIGDSNRFDARTSIKAGVKYYSIIKKQTLIHYGSTQGEYEPLIYLCYHYGQYIIFEDRVTPSKPYSIAKLKESPRYKDSATVVVEATRLEKMLQGKYQLQIQLADIWGRPMPKRKVYIAVPQSTPVAAPKTVTTEPSGETTPTSTGVDAPDTQPGNPSIKIIELETNADGNLEVIQTDGFRKIVLMIPRLDFDDYSEAVSNGLICEAGNAHYPGFDVTGTDSAIPALEAGYNESIKQVPQPKSTPSVPAIEWMQSNEAKGFLQGVTFSDIANGFRDKGIADVRESSFAYLKVLDTKPEFNASSFFSGNATERKAPSPVVISSSTTGTVTSAGKNFAKAITSEAGNKQDAPLLEGTPKWMEYALAEEKKSGDQEVKWNPARPSSDSEWRKNKVDRDNASKKARELKAQLLQEKKKSEQKQDKELIKSIEEQIKEQQVATNEFDRKMLEIEGQNNNPDIIKYLNSTELKGTAAARVDETAWCASFASWCLTQAGYKPPAGSAAAGSWKNWGKELSEPRYGAITVVTRGIDSNGNPLYHVGFYTGMTTIKQKDGTEEMTIKRSDGTQTVKTVPKFKDVKRVKLLSGNFSNKIRDFAGWDEDKNSQSPTHLVTYRWPTEKERQ